jgi:hypothetical protein
MKLAFKAFFSLFMSNYIGAKTPKRKENSLNKNGSFSQFVLLSIKEKYDQKGLQSYSVKELYYFIKLNNVKIT